MRLIPCFILLTFLCLLPGNATCNEMEMKSRKKRNIPFKYIQLGVVFPQALGFFKDIKELWEALLANPNMDINSALFRNKEHETIGHLIKLSSKLSNLENEAKSYTGSVIVTILQAFPKVIKLELKMHDLTLITNQINFAKSQLQKYLILGYQNMTSKMTELSSTYSEANRPDFTVLEQISNNIMKREANPKWIMEKFTLLDFATWATSHNFNSLLSLLQRMNDLVTGQGDDDNLFQQIRDLSEEMKTNACNLKQSPHQTLYNLYNAIAVAELKGNIILQFSYMLLKMYNKGNFTVEADVAAQTYENHSKQKLDIVRKALSDANRSMFKCDPKQYVEDVTHTKLKKLLQGYIENEVNLNPYGTCRENCAYYSYTEYNGCFKNQFCAKQPPCAGKVMECRYVDSDMNICTSSNPERRYEWIEYENGKILGSKGVCEKKNFFKVDSWWRWLFWHCSYCLCLCDDSSQGSDRFFNLRDVTSDIENNKIVTGVRMVKRNQIIHFQIQQGVLTPLGVVNKTTLSWKPVDNYTVDDDNVRNNVDYTTMSWLERAIDTDEVYGPSEHVVTGLRFRKIGTHLNLEVRVTPVNFTSGQLHTGDSSYWVGNDNTEASSNNPRTEVVLNNPDIPIRNGPHILDSEHNQYVQFQASSFETDAAQSVVPYLDSQALTSQGFPLSGIGLIHRGKVGSGGFIAPKLISYDFTPHLRFNRTD